MTSSSRYSYVLVLLVFYPNLAEGACPTIGAGNTFATTETQTGTCNLTGNYSQGDILTDPVLTIDGDMTIDGDLSVYDEIIINGTLTITGNLLIDSDGSFTINNGGTLNVGGDVNVGGPLSTALPGDQNPNGTINGDMNVGGDFNNNSEGEVTVGNGGVLDVDGDYNSDPNSDTTINNGGTLNSTTINDPGGTIVNNDPNGCVDGCCGSQCVVLPVELVTFFGHVIGTTIDLQWTTASETNNDHFLVRRSYDGLEFKTITSIPGNGTSTQLRKYRYTDTVQFIPDEIYYQLHQVDFDGSISIHPIIRLSGDNYYSEQNELQVLPNPVTNSSFQISTKTVITESVQLLIYGMDGKLVHQRNFKNGIGIIKMDQKFKPGHYVVTVGSRESILRKTFIIE